MVLRDHYATAALKSGMCPINMYDYKEIAAWCFDVADAMIKEKEVRDTSDERLKNIPGMGFFGSAS